MAFVFLAMTYTLKAAVDHELVVKKSRFLARVMPVADRSAAHGEVQRLRAEHPTAAHVCWALLAAGQSAAVDDGEPSGTAGRPMLEVLRRQHLEQTLAVVVRYFGGVKLGAGGLVRAYTDAVAQSLLKAEKVLLTRQIEGTCLLPYALEGVVRRLVEQHGAQLLAAEHGSLVTLRLQGPEDAMTALIASIEHAGQGQIGWTGPKITP